MIWLNIMNLNSEFVLPVFMFAITMLFTPGPNNILLMTSGLNYGVKATFWHIQGVALGFGAMFLIVGLGLGSVFIKYPQVHLVIKWLGISFMLYMAWKISTAVDLKKNKISGKPMSFFQAVLFQWVNPKAWLISINGIGAFTTVGGDVIWQVFAICLILTSVGYLSSSSWTIFGSVLQKIITNHRQYKIFNMLMAFFLVMAIIPLILE